MLVFNLMNLKMKSKNSYEIDQNELNEKLG